MIGLRAEMPTTGHGRGVGGGRSDRTEPLSDGVPPAAAFVGNPSPHDERRELAADELRQIPVEFTALSEVDDPCQLVRRR